MPKQKIHYICDKCGEDFTEEPKALECENNHFEPVEIIKFEHQANIDKKAIPVTIDVKLKNRNGTEKIETYTLVDKTKEFQMI